MAERYEIQRAQGEGIWVAQDLQTQARVVMSFFQAIAVYDAPAKARFVAAAELAGQLGNTARHVVKVQGHGFVPARQASEVHPFVVTEFFKGETLAQRLGRLGRLSLIELQPLVRQMALGLQALHNQNVVHAGLGPHNVLLAEADDASGQPEVVKLLACGFGEVDGRDREVAFMSPEQVRGASSLGVQSDLWSLAAIIYAAAVGKPPFGNASPEALAGLILWKPVLLPSQVQSKAMPSFDAWVAKALAREPASRFQTAQELAQAFEAVAVDEGTRQRRIPLPFGLGGGDELFPGVSAWRAQLMSRTGKDRMWNRQTWLLVFGCLLTFVGGGVLVAWLASLWQSPP